jgi:hypothetical protein
MWKVVLPTFCAILIATTGADSQVGKYRSGIFLSHSTGMNIWGPNGSTTSVPLQIHIYNQTHGLSGSDSVTLNRRDWPETPWNNEWERWHRIFNNNDSLADIRPVLSNNKIIMLKSCFPSSELVGVGGSSDTLSPTIKTIFNYKWHWRNFIGVMQQHPEIFFVVWTNAPRTAATTSDQAALLSDQFCRWAKDTLSKGNDVLFGAFPKNAYVFDFFHKLAESNGKLPLQYAVAPDDPHPNSAATALVAPQLVQEIFDAAILYEGGLTVPGVPQLLTPDNGSIFHIDYPTLIWSRSVNANTYHLQISRDSLFNTMVLEDSSLTDTFKQMGIFDNPAKYYWRIRSKNTAGRSNWSERWYFDLAIYPAVPALVSPAKSSTDQPNVLAIKWNRSAAATNYHLEVSSESLFAIRIVDDSMLIDTFKYVGPLENLSKYYWRLRSNNLVGTSDWSEPWNFVTASYTFEYVHGNGWNLISLPLVVSDYRTTELFPSAISSAFDYNGNYMARDTLERGCGYWIKFNHSETVGLTGTPVTAETIAVKVGWNMIGSIGTPIPVSNIISQPVKIITSDIFCYNGSYSISDSIIPGNGYWIKVDQDGDLILNSTNAVDANSRINIQPIDEIPPPPPDGQSDRAAKLPEDFRVSQNYPNPFNPRTTIYYTLPESRQVKLVIYNQLGQEVQTLVDEIQESGDRYVIFEDSNLSSGLYFYKIEAGSYRAIKKMVLIK